MKWFSSFRYVWLLALGLSFLPIQSCVTDEYGRSAVSPGGAVALAVGAAAVGAIIAGSSHDHDDDDWHDCHRHHGSYDRHGHYYRHHYGYGYR